MKVSIFATANRPEFWLNWHKLMERNKTEFEIWACGNIRPGFDLPENFHYVYSEFKPAQCQAIAASHCTGDIMMDGVDDWEYAAGLFDEAVTAFQASTNPYFCFLPKIGIDSHPGWDRTHEWWRVVGQAKHNTPIIPQQAFIRKEFFDKVGGYDLRFLASAQDQDLSMRLLTTPGYELRHMEGFAIERMEWQNTHRQAPLYGRFGPKERCIFDELWLDGGTRPNGEGGKCRAAGTGPHLPYDLATIETKEQGPSCKEVSQWPQETWLQRAGEIARLKDASQWW